MKQAFPPTKKTITDLIKYATDARADYLPIDSDRKIGFLAGVSMGTQDILSNTWEYKAVLDTDSEAMKAFKHQYNKLSCMIICE